VTDPQRFIDPSTPPEVLALRERVDAPDFSAAILGEVERRRGWLSRRQRRLVCAARWGAGVGAVAIFASILLVQRATPVDEAIVPQDRPLADLMHNVRNEASVAVQTVSTQMRSFPEQLVSQSQVIVTGQIHRQGARRVIELDGPVTVVGETPDGLPGMPSPNAPRLMSRASDGTTPVDARRPGWYVIQLNPGEAPLLEAQGLEASPR
jgi:hypothetical protein